MLLRSSPCPLDGALPRFPPSPETDGRKLRRLMTRWRLSLSAAAVGAKSLAAARPVLWQAAPAAMGCAQRGPATRIDVPKAVRQSVGRSRQNHSIPRPDAALAWLCI